MVTTTVVQYAGSTRHGYPTGGHRTRRAALKVLLAVSVGMLLYLGAPARAAEPVQRDEFGVGVGTSQGLASPTLAAIAVPNFITYRNLARVAAGVATGESIRAATSTRITPTPPQPSPTGRGTPAATVCRAGTTEDPLETATAGADIMDAACE
jgi:hypothetical protein